MSLSNLPAQSSNPAKAIPIGFQLYTVRGEFSRDVPGTLKKLAEIGYKAVEFWGYSGTPNVFENYSAGALRKVLDENNLKCCGMHLDLKALAKENFGRTIENNQALGSEFLNLAAAEGKMGSEEAIGELANLLNEREAECKKVGLTIGYHSHGFDFKKIRGRSAWEILFSKLVPEVNMQIDVGNCLGGGGDPIAMLKEFPGRTRTIHIKEHKEKTFDSDFYKEVFQLCETTSGTRWYIVEMGGLLGNAFEVPREALQKLHQIGKK
jgi:sugar phosphate isomerase/epimerase